MTLEDLTVAGYYLVVFAEKGTTIVIGGTYDNSIDFLVGPLSNPADLCCYRPYSNEPAVDGP